MKDMIIQSLKDERIDNYLIMETRKTGVEMFFIRQTLDMTRRTELDEWNIIVYHDEIKDGIKQRGSADCSIHQGMNGKEIRKAIREAYMAAGYALNPYYDIVKGYGSEMAECTGKLAGMTLEKAAGLMAEALFAKDTSEECFVNSAELFVEKKVVSICNSAGVDCGYEDYTVKGEFVVQCLEPSDVELYQSFAYDEPDTDSLKTLVENKLTAVADRAKACKAPTAGNYDVVLSEDSVREMLSFYTRRADASYIYQKYSTYQIGTKVQGESAEGEKLNITLHSSVPYDNMGIKMKDCGLICDGELKQIHGELRLCRYLDVEPTGVYNKMIVENGSCSLDELRNGRVLQVVSFSDFYMDAFSGHFAGEIRLAYLYDNGCITPVTGGSINGSLIECQDNMVFSKERYESRAYSGPYAVLLKNVPVSGEQ